MRTFAFLKNTPDWAKQNNCGQYNGYLAIDIKYAHEIIKNITDTETGEFIDSYINLPQPQEITMHVTATMEEIGPLYPITPIDEEACNNKFLVVGFDTCHSWNSWEKDNYESVKKDTLEWLDEVTKHLETIEEMGA